jgi:orotate phosphoribosyltransferase
MQTQAVLKIFEQTGALLSGHFELRSGLHSERYFQCANVLRYPWEAERLCVALAEKVRRQMGASLALDAVISPALGGILVGHELGRALHVPSIFAEKQDKALVLRRFEIQPGSRYLVAEDVVTQGGRVKETMDIVTAKGGLVEAVAVLVDRSGGNARFDCPTFSLVELAPVTWNPKECPLCAKGIPFVHPGS